MSDTPNPGSPEAIAAGCTCPVLDTLRARIRQLENSLAEAQSECDDLIAQRDEEARNAKAERTRANDAERERDRLAYWLLHDLDGDGDAR